MKDLVVGKGIDPLMAKEAYTRDGHNYEVITTLWCGAVLEVIPRLHALCV